MKPHYFFWLSYEELADFKIEYLQTSTYLFWQKYNISNTTAIKLFWKKGRKWNVWRKLKINFVKKIKIEPVVNNYEDKRDLFKSFNDDYYFNTYL